jgi:hypothetical protein
MTADVTIQQGRAPASAWMRGDRAATRRMCAGVYVDPAFRDELLRSIYNSVRHRTAPSYGFDVVVVLQHAWRAWWISLAEDLALAGFLAGAVIRAPLESLLAAGVLAAWALAGRVRAWAAVAVRHASGQETSLSERQIRAQGRLLGAAAAAAAGAVTAAVIAIALGSPPGPAGGGWADRTGLAGAGVILAGCGAIVAVAVAARMACVARLRHRDPQRGPWVGRRLQVIDAQQHHPFTVYAGFRPFVGSGLNAWSWSFAQRMIHAKPLGTEPDEEFDDPPFTTADLIGRLQQTMREIRDDDNPETRLPGLTVADRVFVEGTRAAPFAEILRSDPGSSTVQTAISDAVAHPGDVARHYLQCQAESWGGEVVTSVFAHASLQGRTLYLEFATYVLLPTQARYRLVDETGGTGPRAVTARIAAAVATLPAQMLAVRGLARVPAQVWAGTRPRKDLTARPGTRLRKDIGTTSAPARPPPSSPTRATSSSRTAPSTPRSSSGASSPASATT